MTHAPPTTNNAGIPVESDEHSLTAGPDAYRREVDQQVGDRIEAAAKAP